MQEVQTDRIIMSTQIRTFNTLTDDHTAIVSASTIMGEWAIAKTGAGYQLFHLPTGLSCPIAAPWTVKNLWRNSPRLRDARCVLDLVQSVPASEDVAWGGPPPRAWLTELAAALRIHIAELKAEKDALDV